MGVITSAESRKASPVRASIVNPSVVMASIPVERAVMTTTKSLEMVVILIAGLKLAGDAQKAGMMGNAILYVEITCWWEMRSAVIQVWMGVEKTVKQWTAGYAQNRY